MPRTCHRTSNAACNIPISYRLRSGRGNIYIFSYSVPFGKINRNCLFWIPCWIPSGATPRHWYSGRVRGHSQGARSLGLGVGGKSPSFHSQTTKESRGENTKAGNFYHGKIGLPAPLLLKKVCCVLKHRAWLLYAIKGPSVSFCESVLWLM